MKSGEQNVKKKQNKEDFLHIFSIYLSSSDTKKELQQSPTTFTVSMAVHHTGVDLGHFACLRAGCPTKSGNLVKETQS